MSIQNLFNFDKWTCMDSRKLSCRTSGPQLDKKETPTQLFSCEICHSFKNNFFYRTPPVTSYEIFCEGFFDIGCENAFSHTRRLSNAATYQFFNYNLLANTFFWSMRTFCMNYLRVLVKNFALCSIYWSNQPLWKMHGIAYINFDCFKIDDPPS